MDAAQFLELGVPVLSSWQAADLVDNFHPNYFGRPGAYGHRVANKILYEADQVVSIGCRRSVPCVGHNGLTQDLVVYDESTGIPSLPTTNRAAWRFDCIRWRLDHKWIESPTHDDTNGFMNSYRIVDAMHKWLRKDEVIVTDMGTALVCAHYCLRLKPPQRLLTSGGLGEMGVALPAAIGASFARNKGEVLCLQCDGGMMQNLQELATIVHHKLPIKIVVFANDGYAMIRGTQNNLRMSYSGVDHKDLTLPDFRKIAWAFGLPACEVRTWEEFTPAMNQLFASKEAGVVVIHIDPAQVYAPKLQPIMGPNGIQSPRFDQLSPLL